MLVYWISRWRCSGYNSIFTSLTGTAHVSPFSERVLVLVALCCTSMTHIWLAFSFFMSAIYSDTARTASHMAER